LYQKIADNYFAILLFQENQQILALKSDYLGERQKSLQSAFDNGVILKADIDKLRAEQLGVHQQNLELIYSIQYLKKNLILLMGIEIEDEQLQIKKSFFIADLNYSKRPEYLTLSAQEQQLLASKELFSNSLSPKLSAFGQLGYSYPGLNFFENQSDPYYIVGVKLGWNIYDWRKTSNEKEILDVQIKNLKVLEEDIDRNFESGESAKLSEIEKLTELIKTDQEIIGLKTSIVKSSSSALDNGTISSTDYLQDLNAEIISRIELNKHTIQLNKNQLELALIKGINIE
jgi:outer membrane protein TolC